eukprot:jgi/Tetstr1/458520/TSEL_044925.t1
MQGQSQVPGMQGHTPGMVNGHGHAMSGMQGQTPGMVNGQGQAMSGMQASTVYRAETAACQESIPSMMDLEAMPPKVTSWGVLA